MLGEQIAEGKGKRTGRRVLGTQPLNVEVTFEDQTKVLGLDGVYIGTYTSIPKPDGSLDGEGQGVFSTLEGDVATWKGVGAGKFLAGGAVSYRGCVCFTSSSPKLSRLNTIAAAFEFEVDAAGNTSTKMWEWK